MFRFRQIAAPLVLGAAVLIGAPGCASDRPDEIPYSANMVGEGKESVWLTATDKGTVYIYDDTANEMVYTGKVEKGDEVRVDARDNRILLQGKTALERDLINDHRFQVFFEADEDDATVVRHREGGTVIQRDGRTTVVQPAPDTTVIQPAPETTVVQPAPDTTVTTPQSEPDKRIIERERVIEER